MKTILTSIFCVFILLNATPLLAQEKLSYSIRGGAGISQITMNGTNSYSGQSISSAHRSSFSFAGEMKIKFSEKWGIQYGLSFIKKGGVLDSIRNLYMNKPNNFVTSSREKVEFRLYHLELPIYATYSMKTNNGNVIIGAGGYVGTPLFGRDIRGNLSKNINTYVDSDDYSFTGVETGLNCLLGYKLQNKLTIDLRYSHGLAGMIRSINSRWVNKVWNMGVSYDL